MNRSFGQKLTIACRSFSVLFRCFRASFGTGLVLACSIVFGAQQVLASEIWLQPNSPYEAKLFEKLSKDQSWRGTGTDFWTFFSGSNYSNKATRNISVVKFSPAFIGDAPKSKLIEIGQWLAAKNIKLAVGIEALSPMNDGCGRGVEGFSSDINGYLNKIKSVNLPVDYFVMDEPLYFGSLANGKNTCRASPTQTASNLHQTLEKIEKLFPQARIGEIEPIPQTNDMAAWLPIYRKINGKFPDVIFADVSWRRTSDKTLVALSDLLQHNHIQFGVIFNAAGMVSDKEWAILTQKNIQRVKENKNIVVDVALFQSWAPQPSHLLPENKFGTMTNMIDFYMREVSNH